MLIKLQVARFHLYGAISFPWTYIGADSSTVLEIMESLIGLKRGCGEEHVRWSNKPGLRFVSLSYQKSWRSADFNIWSLSKPRCSANFLDY